MHADLALSMLSNLFWTTTLVCAPVLGITLLVGLAISVLQVVTQVQEMALAFIPKLITAAVCLIAFGPWMLRTMTRYTVQLWTSVPSLF